MGIKVMWEEGHVLAEAGSWKECAEMLLALQGELEKRFPMPRILILETTAEDMAGDGLEALTGREKEILARVTEGMSNKEIASVLHISERTVKNHLSNIFRKLNVSDRTQAAILALRNV